MGGHLSIHGLTGEEIEEMREISGFSSDQIRSLYQRFKHLDKDNTGSITTEDFFNIPELAMNPLISRVIAVFDEQSNDSVNFKQFCTTLSVFLPDGDRESKLQFAFRIYDVQNDGLICRDELHTVLKLMVGENMEDEQLWMIVDKTIKEADILDHDGKISMDEFRSVLEGTDVENKLSINF